jgi:DNA-binding winged helix-turn-helix (wHTH) protein
LRVKKSLTFDEGALVQGDFHINDWLVQPQINSVERDGKTWHLEPKVMQVLVHLALHPNEVLSKDRLLEAVWHDTFVGDDVLVRCISEIRYVFGDDPKSSRIIQTIPKGGYRLIGAVTAGISGEVAAPQPIPNIESSTVEARHTQKINELVLRYDYDLSHPKEPRVPIADEPHSPSRNGLSHADEANSAYPLIKADEPNHTAVHAERNDVRGHGSSRHRLWSIIASTSLVVLLAALGGAYAWKSMHRSAVDFFWGPVLGSNDPVLFCIADQGQYASLTLRDAADPTHQMVLKDNLTAVVIDDLNAVVQITGILKSNDKKYSLKGEGSTNLTDLRVGPTIFVGAFDNAWTLRLTKSLRYHFYNDPEMTRLGIVDSNSPAHTSWVVDRLEQMTTNNYRDYAIIARFVDSNTGKLAVIVAGVGRGGTIAAGELVTDPVYLAQLASAARASGNKKNMEIVLSTPIIDGEPGSPKVEATYFW